MVPTVETLLSTTIGTSESLKSSPNPALKGTHRNPTCCSLSIFEPWSKASKVSDGPRAQGIGCNRFGNIGALIVRIGFWGILYYNHKKEPPQQCR